MAAASICDGRDGEGVEYDDDGRFDYMDFDDDEPDEMDFVDCGLGVDGQCSKAGSEECDWECPHRNSEHFAGSELWHKVHDAGIPVSGCECGECRAARGYL